MGTLQKNLPNKNQQDIQPIRVYIHIYIYILCIYLVHTYICTLISIYLADALMNILFLLMLSIIVSDTKLLCRLTSLLHCWRTHRLFFACIRFDFFTGPACWLVNVYFFACSGLFLAIPNPSSMIQAPASASTRWLCQLVDHRSPPNHS